jgi:predicted PurR-regulated permease PerM
MAKKIEISSKTIVFTVLFLLSLWVLFQIIEVILSFFIALLIMIILGPAVTRIAKHKVPRALAILLIYVLVFALISAVLGFLIPPLVEQTANFALKVPLYAKNLGISSALLSEVGIEIAKKVGELPSLIIRASSAVFSNVWAVFTIVVISFYLLLAREKLDTQVGAFLGDDKQKAVSKFIDQLEKELGSWMRGELVLMLVVGLLSFVGLTILGIPFALPLALFAGILEFVPIVGPVVAAIPAVLIGFGISPITGFATLALVILVQQLENYVLVPKVMERSAGVSPIATLLAIAIGAELAGVFGVLISVPVYITARVFYQQYFSTKQ